MPSPSRSPRPKPGLTANFAPMATGSMLQHADPLPYAGHAAVRHTARPYGHLQGPYGPPRVAPCLSGQPRWCYQVDNCAADRRAGLWQLCRRHVCTLTSTAGLPRDLALPPPCSA